MITRIVQMAFPLNKVSGFLELFEKNKAAVRAQDGCLSLELLRDTHNPCFIITISRWESEEHLDRYRESELFRGIWPVTKLMFSQPAQAFTLKVLSSQL